MTVTGGADRESLARKLIDDKQKALLPEGSKAYRNTAAPKL
jgi:hypothetical protein